MARPCEYKDNKGTHVGIFHRWGNDYEYGIGDEKVPMTVAIIEDYESGKVMQLPAHSLTFLPRPEFLTDDEAERELLARLAEAER